MSNYKIESLERKTTSTGKALIRATVKDNEGKTTENITIWSGFPNFANIQSGDVVEGDITTVVNGKFTNHTLNPKSPAARPNGSFQRNGGAVAKAMEKKEASIEKFQDNKELSIKVSSTMNKAVELAIAEYEATMSGTVARYALDELIIKWRGWLWLQWDKTGPDDLIPF